MKGRYVPGKGRGKLVIVVDHNIIHKLLVSNLHLDTTNVLSGVDIAKGRFMNWIVITV